MIQTIRIVRAFCDGFLHPKRSLSHCHREDRAVRDNLAEDQVDTMVEDTFPASDPPSTY
ncbi:hypothetical protein ATDW_05000 [Asticcacaulis sp. DW145]|uniref:Uncharacterized protein n=1 Tax=Asticcacaulis currens TaxID=2984210 RepID=A0ABT5ID12_9CAUL|nr:hypothetical protein [Asticcacaulis currens]MDC7694049.1 hypothetical protein [Asticcacaulis currens]BEV10004.1 hypothetical protein ATDW_05000 [Asticcacaulis sp. DW145]